MELTPHSLCIHDVYDIDHCMRTSPELQLMLYRPPYPSLGSYESYPLAFQHPVSISKRSSGQFIPQFFHFIRIFC